MKTILGRIVSFVSGTVFGAFAWTIFLVWGDTEDDSYILNLFPNARHRYAKDIDRARAEERAKISKLLKDTFKVGD